MLIHPTREALSSADPSCPLQPVWAEVVCDTQTPVGAYARLRGHYPHPYLLESVLGGERWARYSFLGLGHRLHVRGRIEHGTLRFDLTPGEGFELPPDLPAEVEGVAGLRQVLARFRGPASTDLPRFWGGLVGVWGHDFVRSLERLEAPTRARSPSLPPVELVASDTVVVFDNVTQRVKVVATACPAFDGGATRAWEWAAQRVRTVCEQLQDETSAVPPVLSLEDPPQWVPKIAGAWGDLDFPASVRRAKEHIAAGDIFQVVLAQGFEASARGVDALDVYRVLRATNPSPYMYMMELPAARLVGASPEVLVRFDRDEQEVMVRPIAGTRPRGRDRAHDLALEQELLADPKERAEHLMLIDLGRNDIGRVSQGGTVRMTEEFAVERYSRVMHIVSEVVGLLRPGLDAFDVLGATFPAGTLSGAPKVRALELIDELEAWHRGWYGGAVGYMGYDGGADFAICIRSAVERDGQFLVQAGAGIVFDSDPDREDEECRNKAHAVLHAIEVARANASQSGGEA